MAENETDLGVEAMEAVEPALIQADAMRILLLDDDDVDRRIFRTRLAQLRISADLTECSCLESFREHLRTRRYDVIVVDHGLPVGDGFDAVAAVRASPVNDLAGVVMLTGKATDSIGIHAFRLGCDDFLAKDGMTAQGLDRSLFSAAQHAARRTGEPSYYERHRLRAEALRDVTNTYLSSLLPVTEEMRGLVTGLRNGPFTAQVSAETSLMLDKLDQVSERILLLTTRAERMQAALCGLNGGDAA